MIFIGIHCRRTDYKDHYEKVSGSSLGKTKKTKKILFLPAPLCVENSTYYFLSRPLVDHVYFNRALEIYR